MNHSLQSDYHSRFSFFGVYIVVAFAHPPGAALFALPRNSACDLIAFLLGRFVGVFAFLLSEVTAFIRTDKQTDMARLTRLVILIKNTYIYFMGTETYPSACYILSDESSIPFYSTSNRYKNYRYAENC